MNAIAIGRGTPYGNPYRLGYTCARCGELHVERGSTLGCFVDYALERLAVDPNWLDALTHRPLSCPGCPDTSSTCHGRVLRRMANEVRSRIEHAAAYDAGRLLAAASTRFVFDVVEADDHTAWLDAHANAAERSSRYAGARMSTVGRRVVAHAPRKVGRPMRHGSFAPRHLEPLLAPAAVHWSEVA